MFKGRAVGGPRNQVMIEAGSSWNGSVAGDPYGYYEWSGSEWQWIVGRRKPEYGWDDFVNGEAAPKRGRRRK